MLKTLSLRSPDDTGFQYSSHLRLLGRNQSLVRREQRTELGCRERLLLGSGASGCTRETGADTEPGSAGHQLLLAARAEAGLGGQEPTEAGPEQHTPLLLLLPQPTPRRLRQFRSQGQNRATERGGRKCHPISEVHLYIRLGKKRKKRRGKQLLCPSVT